MKVALILSGGTGTRLGSDIPKQYIAIGKKPIIAYSILQLSNHPVIDAIQIVADASWREQIRKWLRDYDRGQKFRGFSEPGPNRQMSIFHGLEDISGYAKYSDYVMIQDAVRPLLSEKLITDCFAAAARHDGVMPVLPMKDTLYLSKNGTTVSSLLNRPEVFSGQSPEAFVLGKYLDANKRLLPDEILKISGSTEPAVMAGMDIAMIPGDERNYKITTQADLERFQTFIEETSKGERTAR